jgi:hypothetical protein
MNPEQHMLCTKALSLTIKKMASLDFPAYQKTGLQCGPTQNPCSNGIFKSESRGASAKYRLPFSGTEIRGNMNSTVAQVPIADLGEISQVIAEV